MTKPEDIRFKEPGNPEQLELGETFTPAFNDQGLIPCITVDHDSDEILMHAWMNRDALAQTISTRLATYYSRSREKIWVKGEHSGRLQDVLEIRTDCDQDTLQVRVRQRLPGACHRGFSNCFYRRLDLDQPDRLNRVLKSPEFDSDDIYNKKKPDEPDE